MADVYLSLGTNLGDRRTNLRQALALLPPHAFVQKMSSLYETVPHGVADQPFFYNLVAKVTTKLAPHDLLEYIQGIERELGRADNTHHEPRIIDIDILFFDDLILNTEDLVIPHPRLHERAFVLVPLEEIAPLLEYPGTPGQVVADLHAAVTGDFNSVWPAEETI